MKRLYKEGFTLIETLIAITVLLIAIVAPMSLASEGVLAARLAQDQIVAFYLAQEGVELVRNIRDENRLSSPPVDMLGGNLLDCVVDPVSSDPGCYIDSVDSFRVESCSVSCPVLRKDDNVYTYNISSTFEDTKYTRQIRTWYTDDSARNEAIVEVTVFWPFRTTTRSYTLRSNLTNW